MIIYVVHPGDSLFLIAQRYGVTVQALIKANRLISNKLAIGQRLFIPVSAPVEYTVKSGDTLYHIANRYDTTIEAIMLLNDLKSPDLSIGQKLIIPVYTEFIIQVNTANLRGYASTQAPIAGKIDRGARLPVTGIMGNWIKVRLYDGRTAWTHRTNGRLVPTAESSPSKRFSLSTRSKRAPRCQALTIRLSGIPPSYPIRGCSIFASQGSIRRRLRSFRLRSQMTTCGR
ncbi:LysM peptidoglycan-binding domain-containing protein [Paenibacillus sp. TAB 01]|uniref:LysM peptidoglycan-binding domain-containing protein n=1 Tax=Paenibacillus sp. TAB 01 TaxID=3368988 RepID=UPI003751A567